MIFLRENVVGLRVRKLRRVRNWSYAMLVLRLRKLGWEVSARDVIDLERGTSSVLDFHLVTLAAAFGVGLEALYPPAGEGQPSEVIQQWREGTEPAPISEVPLFHLKLPLAVR